ncbi:MAG: glycosyltransferase family 4 protein [bacterium]
MKILLINKYYYLRGGAERYFFDLKDLLEKNGHTVILFSMAHEKNERTKYEKYFADRVEFIDVSLASLINIGINCFKFFYNWDAVLKLEHLIKDEKPDIAHIHNIAHQLSPAIINMLRKHKVPIIQTIHDYKIVCPAYLLFYGGAECRVCSGGKYYRCFLKKCLKNSRLKSFIFMCEAYFHNKILKTYDKVDLFVAPTNFVKNIFVKAGISENRIKTVKGFLAGAASGIKHQELSKIEGGYLLYFGRLSTEKGIYVLLEAMKKTGGNLRLKIVGEGSEREKLELRIKNYELQNKVEILGAKYGEELKKIIIEARAVIIPSICPESMCYSLLEAMAIGKIVIASRIGAIEEFVEDGKNGFLFNPGDSVELAEKINLLFCGNWQDPLMGLTPLDKADIANRAKKTVSEFCMQKHYEEIMKIYNSCLM